MPAGRQRAQGRRTPMGYLGGQRSAGAPAVIQLVPKQEASALVEGTSVGSDPNCGSYASLLVTPPGETHSVTVATSLPACSGLQVHPVVPGSTGSTGSN